tara:strand:- start:776 stop:1060 length:285 start_codon:yes stop_codon:yes gene_type:complete
MKYDYIETSDIKKGYHLLTTQLGANVPGTMEDNKIGGNVRLIHTKGSTIGLFDEYGSVYVWDIAWAKQKEEDEWKLVKLTDRQENYKKELEGLL